MASATAMPLPPLPAGWTGEKGVKIMGSLSATQERHLEPVGPHFLAHARRKRHGRTFSEDERIQAQQKVTTTEDVSDGEFSEDEDPLMLQRDAKDWKGQDHYAVLGLSKFRHRATSDQIKRAHRKKVLKHHPDKKAAQGATEDDSFFKCIQKANEILLDPIKRRQFDSVDEAADVEPPSKKQSQKGDFFALWHPVFDSEARFSKRTPVPQLGDDSSTREQVEHFYDFWYNFDSWRTFEYEDEDVPDDNENRDQKRHVERKNANARKKKKTEDTARLRKVVDDALALDERIKKFKKEARAGKDKKRLDKEAEEKKRKEDAVKAKEAEEREKKEAEERAKSEKADAKKVKEAAKNAAKKNKRIVRASVKDTNYFHEGGDAPAGVIDKVLNQVDLVIARQDSEELAAFTEKLSGKKGAAVKAEWGEEAKRLEAAGKVKASEIDALK